MAKHKVFDYYKDLPAWAKGVVVVGGAAILYFTARSVFKKLKEAKDAKNSKEAVQDAKNDMNSLIKKGVKPSFSATQYKTWANSIEQAFSGCDANATISWGADSPLGAASVWSTSGYKVATIFGQFKNEADYLSLLTAFDVRTYDACGWWTGDVKDVDLVKAIADELTDRERSNLNKILAKKGIKYSV